ncbi:hypothetical protein GO730_03500 [Spirosoma sp. HMF3257]|uniref:Uncharacterized protein n=1 Tax=Spirosoma telluris TaxID=2183553 RepID=A0A327NEF0_9BACT|nr:hypothetical protein [Spirosoma telluris]RAI73701.1 hypothetical protein HMF3257_03435 [Spirosoma telluris]
MRYYLGWIALLFLPVLGEGRSISFPVYRTLLIADTAKEVHHKFQLIPLPVIFYTPETKIAYGVLGVCLFRTDSTARTSNVDFAIIHTQNAQTVIEPTYTIFTKQEKYLIRGMLLYTKFPELYYGIGPGTADSQEELISYKSLRAYNRFLRKLKPGWFVGIQQQYFKNIRHYSFVRSAGTRADIGR